jgi:hypothetical protein
LRTGVSRSLRIAAGLALAAVVGFLLGACGGGGGSSVGPVSGATVAQPTAPERTRTLAAPATTTVAVTTTAPAPTSTTTPRTVTIRPQTTTTATTTISVTPVATTSGETSSSSETPWGWIALVLALTGVAALIIGLWSRRRSRASSWSSHLDDVRRRSLVALDDVLARGSVVTGSIQALEAEVRSLERHAPDDRATATAAQLRGGLEELADALDADRTLRLASPPPSEEQLAYSTALIRQQVEQLQGVLRGA